FGIPRWKRCRAESCTRCSCGVCSRLSGAYTTTYHSCVGIWTKQACGPIASRRWMICAGCRSHARATSAIPIRLDCWRCGSRSWCAFMPPQARPASPPSSATLQATSACGRRCAPAAWPAAGRRRGITAVNIYGLSEVIGPGVSNECIEEQNGAHIFEDHFLPEVINPQTEEPVPFGEIGELVFTTLTKEALPVIRYRTGDLASLDPAPCRCGRTFVRMSRIMGRTDDMLIIRGVNVYPTQVEAALLRVAELSPHYQLVVTR